MLEHFRKKLDTESYGIILSVLLTMAVCLQLLIVIAAVFSFIPIKLDSSLDAVLPQVVALFRPEREMAFYQLFVVATVMVQAAIVIIFKERLRDENFLKRLSGFLFIEYVWISLLLFAVFKILVYKEPLWAKVFFFVVLAASLVSKVFWVEIKSWTEKIYAFLVRQSGRARFILACDLIFLAGMIVLLWIPDPKAALGRVMIYDRFYNFDTFLMSPILAYLNGGILNIDTFSPLGVTAPVLIGRLTQVLGGFSYEHALQVLVILSIMYCAAIYTFLRVCLNSVGIAVCGTLLFIKLHFFHASTTSIIWATPQESVIKIFFDPLLFYFLWRHACGRKTVWLLGAACACGWSLAYMPDTGLYQTLAFYGYLALTASMFRGDEAWFVFPRDIRKLLLNFILPWILAGIVLIVVQGKTVFSTEFLRNSLEFMNSFWQGIGNVPLHESLKARQFFALFMGLGIPVFFVFSAMKIVSDIHNRVLCAKNIWIAALCFYGLAAHYTYISRSEPAGYYIYAMPFIFVVCFWVKRVLELVSRELRRKLIFVMMTGCLLALLTNNLLIQYPNALNLSGHNWREEREFLRAQLSLDTDALLMRDLTKPGERAAIISSFSTKILMDASRGPLLYYSPVIVSSLLTANEFRGTTLFSTYRMEKTTNELETKKPPVVFVEKKILRMQFPKEYEGYLQSWLRLKNYLEEHYDSAGEGKYLLVLRRKI